MANQLPMTDVQSVLTLYERGWSRRRIARELGLNRGTVNGYVHRHLASLVMEPAPPEPTATAPSGNVISAAAAKPAIPHTGSEPATDPKPAIPHTGSGSEPNHAIPHIGSPAIPAGRPSECIAY